MKSATAHDPGLSRVSDTPTGSGVYPTRIRKQKRRHMASSASASRSRTRAEVKDRSSRDTPPSDGTASGNSPMPDAAVEQVVSEVASPASDKARASSISKERVKSVSRSVSGSPAEARKRRLTWDVDEVSALGGLIGEKKSVDIEQLMAGSEGEMVEGMRKRWGDVAAALELMKAPFDTSRVPFAPKCDVSSLLAAIAAQVDGMKAAREGRDGALAKLEKAKSETERIEKANCKLIRETKILAEEVEKQRSSRNKTTEKRIAAEARLEVEKDRLENGQSARVALRGTLEKQKFAELEMRRRLDRMRLKVSALRGQMVTASVEQLAYDDPAWLAEPEERVDSMERDPLGVIREGIPSKRRAVPKRDTDGDGSGRYMDLGEGFAVGGVELEEAEMKEDADATQLRLLKNRLAMCEMEADEWRRTLEAEKGKVAMLKRAKVRLEDEVIRMKQGGKIGMGSGGRGIGKGAGANARAAAKMRAHGRAAMGITATDLSAKKPLKKSRKGRPRKSLVPFP